MVSINGFNKRFPKVSYKLYKVFFTKLSETILTKIECQLVFILSFSYDMFVCRPNQEFSFTKGRLDMFYI